MARVNSLATSSLHDAPTVWRSVDEIDLDAWDTVRNAQDIFMDVRFLRAVECSMAPATDFWYLLFRDEQGRPAANACLSTYVIDGTLLVPSGATKQAIQWLGRVLPWTVYYKLLFCGIPLSSGQSHLRFAPGVDESAIIGSLCQIMDRIAAEERARVIVWKEFRDDERTAADQVEQHGYRRADSLPMNLSKPQWNDFDEFLASCKASRRRDIRKSLRKLEGKNIRVVETADPAEVRRWFTDEAHGLYVAMFERSDTKVEFMPPAFFRELPVQLPDNCHYQFFIEDDHVLAFGASVFTEDSYHPVLAGVDYSRNSEFDLYFNLVYQNFADALGRGVSEIHVGANADEFKQRQLACRPDPRSIYVKGARVPIRLVLRLLFDRLFPPIDAQSVHQ